MMFFRRRRTAPTSARRPDQLAIAVMEYEELGIQPEPGSAAALAIGLRAFGRTGTCAVHDPVAVTSFGDPAPNAICTRCGQHMLQDEHGDWRLA